MKLIGILRGKEVFASEALLATYTERKIRQQVGIPLREFPVKTSLSGDLVYVNAISHEEAVRKWLTRKP